MTDNPLREVIARVLEPQAWRCDTLAYKNRRTSSLRKADAAIAAIEASGTHCIMPMEPTEIMLLAAAFFCQDDCGNADRDLALGAYKAILAVRPPPRCRQHG